HQGARPRAAVELLRRPAVDLQQGAHRPLGPLRAPERAAEIRRGGVSDDLVVGRREGRQDRDPPVTHPAARLTRRGTLVLSAGALASAVVRPATAEEERPERHGISAFGDLKYPSDFKRFDYVNPDAPKGGLFSYIGSTRIYNQNFLTFNSLN